ncbi:RNase H domain-containing protein [Meloidogyne graminicola]|uniref:ribonuclease H n=1 Tax=Meloidogyne graminicola TaxID=189291 RepID=A0A8S9ZR11_9BILA|nr:RNase H domain-containing protein [Meloidogyne graminicola]
MKAACILKILNFLKCQTCFIYSSKYCIYCNTFNLIYWCQFPSGFYMFINVQYQHRHPQDAFNSLARSGSSGTRINERVLFFERPAIYANRSTIQVYTDASTDIQRGSGIGMYYGREHPLNQGVLLRDVVNSGLAEVIAARTGLKNLLKSTYYNGENVDLNTDYEQTIRGLQSNNTSRAFAGDYQRLRDVAEQFPHGVLFRWVPGHEGIEGNEEADSLAWNARISEDSGEKRGRSRERSRHDRISKSQSPTTRSSLIISTHTSLTVSSNFSENSNEQRGRSIERRRHSSSRNRSRGRSRSRQRNRNRSKSRRRSRSRRSARSNSSARSVEGLPRSIFIPPKQLYFVSIF